LNGLSLAHAVAGRQRSDTLQNRLHGIGGIEDCRAKVGLGLEIKRRAELRLGPTHHPYDFLSVDGLTPFGGLRGLDIAYVDVAITASGLNLR